jgi:hypothetical protein
MPMNSYNIEKEMRTYKMGKLIIDGNSFFEIDEECLKKKKISKRCGLDKYLKDQYAKEEKEMDQSGGNKKRGDG